MARPKLTPLARDLRSLAAPTALDVDIGGHRRHFAAKGSRNATPTQPKPVKESAAASLYTSDIITLLFQTLQIMPDPDEVLMKAGLTRAALRKLAFDDEISQAVETRRDAAINTPWRLEGGLDEANKFITDEIEAKHETLFSGIWNARLYGYSVTQCVYQDRGERVGLAWVGEMPFEYYFPQRDGTVKFRPYMQGLPVPVMAQKYVIPIINPTYKNPYGDALLSRLYWMWFFRTHGWQYWIQWLEQFGAPFLHGKTQNSKTPVTGATTSTSAVDALASLLDKSRRGSSIATDLTTEISVIESKNSGAQFKDFDAAVTRQIDKVILGQTLTSSEGEHGGNRALGAIHEEVRQDKRRSDVKLLVRGGQMLVNYLFELNGFGGDCPVFVMEDEKGLQKDRADRDSGLVKNGVLLLKREYLEDAYDLQPEDFIAPDDPEWKELKALDPTLVPLPDDQAGNAPGKPVKKGAPPAAKKQGLDPEANADLIALFTKYAKQRFTPEQEVIEAGVAQMVERLPGTVVPVDLIRDAIVAAASPSDLEARLAIVCEQSRVGMNEFRIVLERALGVAQIIGYVHAAERPTPPVKAAQEPPPAAPQTIELHVHTDGAKTIRKNDDGTWTTEPVKKEGDGS